MALEGNWIRPFSGATGAAGGLEYVDLAEATRDRPGGLSQIPFTIRVLLENALRSAGPGWADEAALKRLRDWAPGGEPFAVPLRVSRVILPDSSGLPALMDLAGLRRSLARAGHDAAGVSPRVPVDLVVDHSLIVDHFGSPDAASLNVAREFERNAERYTFFKWARQAFDGLRVVPPGMGIVHQVHLERLARVVATEERDGRRLAFPEFVLGGDSHTPMVNALGVLAWGVGGVEAEAAILGRPYVVPVPRVVGVRLSGTVSPGVTTTDIVLSVTERLRAVGVVGAFVEFTGPGLSGLSVPDRATIANMAPEYGATVGFFPIDARTLEYLAQTGRDADQVALVETYARAAGFFRDDASPEPSFDASVDFDLGAVAPSLAGPSRPQDRLGLSAVKPDFQARLGAPRAQGGFSIERGAEQSVRVDIDGESHRLRHGAVAIAAITACTNTSNPSVMLAAGLLARNAVARGLKTPAYVKTSLAPGSRVVARYLRDAGLLEPLERLGFFIVGYGCTTCSGKSGPLPEPMAEAIEKQGLLAAAVVSSNRNFEGRIHRQLRAAYLASPPLVVAYALAGRVDIDLTSEPIGTDARGQPVHLADIWPSPEEVAGLIGRTQVPALYLENYAELYDGTDHWRALKAPNGPLYPWEEGSTYLLAPPFFDDAGGAAASGPADRIEGARILGLFGDSLTTDHISPAGEIPVDSAAGRFLAEAGVAPRDFNAYTMRRGNHHVMARGTFANIRIRNELVPGGEGGVTLKLPEGERMSVFAAAQAYRAEATPLIVLAGKDYGMGSSRDWAAKGPALLGVRAVIADSFERIHRANLIALGIAPLVFRAGQSWRSLGLSGRERYSLSGLRAGIAVGAPIGVTAQGEDDAVVSFEVDAAILAPAESETLLQGGMFRAVWRQFAGARADRPATGT